MDNELPLPEQPSTGETSPEMVANPEKVKAIVDWLESQTGYASFHTFEELVSDAPPNVSKADVRSAFLKLKPRGTANEDYDCRGYYLTALADKVLGEEYERRFAGQEVSEEAKQKFWDEEARIELERPTTGKYYKFREIGHDWRRGTLVLIGNFGRDQSIGGSLRGGKVEVLSDVGPSAGSLMMGGKLEIQGNADWGLGFGMRGGDISVHGNVAANAGERMHAGSITVDGTVDRMWNQYGQTQSPNIGLGKEGGQITVDGKTY